MTTSAFSPAPTYTISGPGPYDVPHDYGASAELVVSVIINDIATPLDTADYTVVPDGPATSGTVFLTAGAASLYDGETLSITRDTTVSQIWEGLSSTANGLEAQLDQMTRGIQNNQLAAGAAENTASELAAAIAGGSWRTSASALAQDTALTYSPGTSSSVTVGGRIRTLKEGYAYEVAQSTATDFHLETAGGVKLYVEPGADGVYNFAATNPAADGVTDDFPKLRALLDAPGTGSGFYQSSPAIYFPNGSYYMSQTLELKRSVRMFGNHSGLPNTAAAKLVFPTDTMGIVVNRYNTLNSAVEAVPTTGADGTILEGLIVESSTGSDKTKHGIWLRARAVLRNVTIQNFSGNGVHIVATAGNGQDLTEGNANNWVADTLRIVGCGGHGFYTDGADVNAGFATQIDCSSNGRSGIYDSSFLGNTYVGCHVATNGLASLGGNAADQSSFVSFGGNRYAAHWNATEADLVATQPGTDDNIWVLDQPGGVHATIPLWTSAKPEGTYFTAFSYQDDNLNARNVFMGCYAEGGASGSAFRSNGMILGGSIGWVMAGDYMRKDAAGHTEFDAIAFDEGGVSGIFGGNVANGDILQWSHPDDTAGWPWRLRRKGADYVLDNANGAGNRTAFTLHGENTTLTCGTSVAQPYFMSFQKIGIGSGANIRRQFTGTAAPTSGEWGRGDITWNINTSAGGKAGWICTTAGTAGSTAVFKTFCAIDT